MRIEVDDETPVLQGTTAQIKGVGFTGVSEIQLGGAVKGARPITQLGPQGCPVIPASSGGLGALLNSAPELIDRIQRLTERLTELLSDENQNAISDILENVERTTDVLAKRAPDLADAMADARIAVRQAGQAADRVSVLADSTNALVIEQGVRRRRICARRLLRWSGRRTTSMQWSPTRVPALQNLSKSTLPEANRLIRDMRELSQVAARCIRTGRAGRRRRHLGAAETPRLQAEEAVMRMLRVVAPAVLALAVCGCSISGLLGGGGKAPGDLADPDARSAGDR